MCGSYVSTVYNMLRTDLKPSARFKAVWPVLKPYGRIVSGPGPFYIQPSGTQTALKPSSPVERRVLIHAARVQLGLSAPRERQRTCNSKERTTPARSRSSARSRAPPAPLTTFALFLPVRRCYARSSLSPSSSFSELQVDVASVCRIVPPGRPHSIACPALVSVRALPPTPLLILPACQWSERA